MKLRRSRYARLMAFTLTAGLMAPGAAFAADPALICEKIAAKSLQSCVKKISRTEGKCYLATGAACGSEEPKVDKALAALAKKVGKKCSDANVQAAGYGPSMTAAALVERLQAACTAEVASFTARSFGGPHGAALAAAGAAAQCLEGAHKHGTKFLSKAAKLRSSCIGKVRKGASCDTAKSLQRIADAEAKALEALATACTDTPLEDLVALDATEFLARADGQARCMTAIAHPDSSPLDLDCGPRPGIAATPRGEYVQIVLDEAEWGTRCGDGSPFAFWIRLAPEGEPVENILLQMEGGGVCIFEDECMNIPAALFEALSDTPGQSGIMSNDPNVSPFANWTKVYLPYCNQDVFIGGGTTSNFASVTVHRFGAINVRAALSYLRDVIWRELDAETDEGYRADRVRFLFGGVSAGGFGTLFNYHYVLDELQWSHTAAWPDAALSLDNGEPLGIAALGLILFSETPPLGWGAKSYFAPYCFATNCGVGPVLLEATSPRLKAAPEQQFLILSNQIDETQVFTQFFSDIPSWLNTARQAYCDTKGLNGVRYFLPAITEETHVISTRENLYTGYSIGGLLMRDWLELGMTDPDNLVDAVEEGTLVMDYPGTNPFPCSLD